MMRIKSGFSLRQSGEKYGIINEISGEFILSDMTETEIFLWEKAKEEFSAETLIAAILNEFCVDGATAELEAYDFISTLKNANAI